MRGAVSPCLHTLQPVCCLPPSPVILLVCGFFCSMPAGALPATLPALRARSPFYCFVSSYFVAWREGPSPCPFPTPTAQPTHALPHTPLPFPHSPQGQTHLNLTPSQPQPLFALAPHHLPALPEPTPTFIPVTMLRMAGCATTWTRRRTLLAFVAHSCQLIQNHSALLRHSTACKYQWASAV